MPRNDEGEFELVLGNRQLLSVFFIVVVLLGVFFTMGWIVGRNSLPASTADVARRADGPTSIVVDPRGGSPDQPAASVPPAQPRSEPAPAQAAKPSPIVERRKSEPPAEPAKSEAENPAPAPAAAPSTASTPPPGQYLQVSAVGKPEAELMVDVLNKKGFRALSTQVPNSALYRVLVGPLADASAISKTRTDLQNAGLKGYDALVRKY